MMNTENEWKDLRASVLQEAGQPAATRPWTQEGATLFLVHGAVALVALVMADAVYGHSPKLSGAGTPLFVGAAFCGVIATLAVGRISRVFALVGSGLFAFGALSHVAVRDMSWDAPWWAYADCALGELFMALLPFVATTAALRRFAFRRDRALMGGVAAAATGLWVLDLTCPSGGAYHALLFHLVPALFVVVAAVAVRRVLKSRSHVP